MDAAVQIFLVDDEPDVTGATRWLLESVGLHATAFNEVAPFLDALPRESGPACVVLDLRMPGRSGLELMEHLADVRPDVPVLFLSAHGDVPSAVRAMKLGAVDFLQKPCNPQQFLEHVGKACRLARERHAEQRAQTDVAARLATLSRRERDVFRRMLDGQSSKESGRALDISPKTVDVHRANIVRKLGATSSRDAQQRFRGVEV